MRELNAKDELVEDTYMFSNFPEQIVMTPKKKTRNSTTLMMERKVVMTDGGGGKVHVAGGSNAGIVVNKQTDGDGEAADAAAHLCLEFRVFLVNANTKRFTQEKRRISYWFKLEFPEHQRAYAAQEFFKELVSPVDFPRGNKQESVPEFDHVEGRAVKVVENWATS